MKELYYKDKISSLSEIFGYEKIELLHDEIIIGDKVFPVIDDVIIALSPSKYTSKVKQLLNVSTKTQKKDFAEDIQETFGAEWEEYNEILPEHKLEFESYFDLIDLNNLKDKRVTDLGCGIGRWAHFVAPIAREMVLVDFSDAVFVARNNLRQNPNCIFIMSDILDLPFEEKFSDFIYCLGVLHHLPVDCLDATRKLSKYSNNLLIYLYYGLDNRAFYFRFVLNLVTLLRIVLSSIKSKILRSILTEVLMWSLYIPIIKFGRVLSKFGIGRFIPLHEFYSGMSLKRIRQDVYDRFFTRIEQRVTRLEIQSLEDTFNSVEISTKQPYWHFLCRCKG
jgi:SAM-dependent methyltransferase